MIAFIKRLLGIAPKKQISDYELQGLHLNATYQHWQD